MASFLHIGGGRVLAAGDIIGIFDMDTATVSRKTRSFLSRAEKQGSLAPDGIQELPKAFILCDGGVYMTQLSPASLAGRLK